MISSFLTKSPKLLARNTVWWNVAALVVLKLALSFSGIQLAAILEQAELFDSRDIIAGTNTARLEYGLAPLKSNTKLDLAAYEKMHNMIADGYFAHINPDGTTPWFWIKKAGYDYIYAGENLAIGFPNADEAVKAWLNSPSHRDNLLNPSYGEIGVAVGTAEIDGYNGILVVQMFGKPKEAVLADNSGNEAHASTLLPTASPVSSVVPVPEITEAPLQEPLAQTETVKLSYVSTDMDIAPISAPTEAITEGKKHEIKQLSNLLNNAFMIYTMILTAISILFVILAERKREHIIASMAHIVVMAAALTLPVFETITRGIIF